MGKYGLVIILMVVLLICVWNHCWLFWNALCVPICRFPLIAAFHLLYKSRVPVVYHTVTHMKCPWCVTFLLGSTSLCLPLTCLMRNVTSLYSYPPRWRGKCSVYIASVVNLYESMCHTELLSVSNILNAKLKMFTVETQCTVYQHSAFHPSFDIVQCAPGMPAF